jgi:hypothetical protein
MDTNDRTNSSDETRGIDYSSSNTDQELHNINRQNSRSESFNDDEEPTNVGRAKSENDDYSNTGNSANYSASDRKEKLTDENYGMTGQYTRKDIINKFESKDENESEENKNS